jgi:hypothetical protein
MAKVDHISVLATAPAHSSAPDSITLAGNNIWVAYTNGADSTGLSGASTIVEYDKSGRVEQTYQIAGYVDGLKFDPVTHEIWALQNQDGNSTLTVINSEEQSVTLPMSYATPSATRGYDDVVFTHGKVFESYTNPVSNGDPTVVQLTNGADPDGATLHTKTILTFGATGINLENGKTEVIPQNDPDSLKVAPNGDLLLTSGADDVIIDIRNPGTAHQAVAFTKVQGVTGGLDDVIKPDATAGTFYLSDTADNRVLTVHMTGLNPNDYYASVGNAFGQVDPITGHFTPLVNAADAPGFKFGRAHGAEFVADKGAPPTAMADHISVLAAAPAHASAPDSITVAGDDIWVAYTNGADSTGLSGHSTIVEYDKSGHVDQTYQIAGYVDGLKFNPLTHEIWALQNQDGNSTLTVINPEEHSVTLPMSYATPSSTRGYDDVVFTGGKVFESYTNPLDNGDPTLVQLTNGADPDGATLHTKTILMFGATGINLETGKTEVVPQNDPDSLKVAPNGDLLLTSGADDVIIDIQNPGTAHQAVAFTKVQGVTGGLDDVIKPNATAGTFYLSDTADNRVLTVHATGFNPNDYYASVGNAFGQVDPLTGQFTALVTAANAPDFHFGSAHGAAFVADKAAPPTAVADHISVLATAPAHSSGPDSITLDGNHIWVAYTNGADSTGLSGHSTIVEYDQSGHVDQTYQIAGYVDGLKMDPVTHEIWALQNQDGNSTLTLINPEEQSVTLPMSYAIPSATRGYDDVAFLDGKVYESYTNPVGNGDATLVQVTNGNDPDGATLNTKPILAFGATGLNTETGKTEVIPQNDPDSLKVAPNGDLLLTSGADDVIIDVHNPGSAHQSVSFTKVQGVTGGLDDVIKPNATAGTFYLSDTADNRVLTVHVTGLNTNDYYASVGNAFGQVDPTTGQFTALVTAANAPGFKFGSAHGAEFVADQNHNAVAHAGGADPVASALAQLSADAAHAAAGVMTAADVHIGATGVHTELHAGLHFG